jgi:single-stranded DNA-binding protein
VKPLKKNPPIFIAGNLISKPLLQKNAKGQSFTYLTLVTNQFSYNQGHWDKTPYWHSVLVRGKTAETCSKCLNKGCPLAIEGFLENPKNKSLIIADSVHFLGLRTMAEQYGDFEEPPVAPKNSKED